MIDVWTLMQRNLGAGYAAVTDTRRQGRSGRIKGRGKEASGRMTGHLVNDVQEKIRWETQRELHRGPVRTLNEMTEEEIQALEKEYGCCVKRPTASSPLDAEATSTSAPDASQRPSTPTPSAETTAEVTP